MKVALHFDVNAPNSHRVKLRGQDRSWIVRVCFTCEREIELPSAPTVGMSVEFRVPVDYLTVEIKSVIWEHHSNRFSCICENHEGDDTEAGLIEDAEWWEAAGFKVDRSNLCVGWWDDLPKGSTLAE